MKEKSSHSHNHSVSNIKVAFLLNFFFTVLELIGGILFNSMAILSDALHDLGDSISLGLAWVFGKLSQKDQNLQDTLLVYHKPFLQWDFYRTNNQLYL